jgi:hypothetical protein
MDCITGVYRLLFFAFIFTFFGILIKFSALVDQISTRSFSYDFYVIGVLYSAFGMIVSLSGFIYTWKKDIGPTDVTSIILIVYTVIDLIVLIMLFDHTPAVVIPIITVAILSVLMLFYCVGSCCRSSLTKVKNPETYEETLDDKALKVLEEDERDVPQDEKHE